MRTISEIPPDASFADAVVSNIGVVLASEGFRVTRATAQAVLFQSNIVEIEAYYDSYSFELGLDVKWVMYPDRSFSLSELLRLWNHPQAATYRNFIAADQSSMVTGLQRLAQLLSELFLLGMRFDQTVLHNLQDQQAALSEKMARDSLNRRARTVASQAWAQKNFLEFVKALKEIPDGDLTEREARQIAYATDQMGRR